MSERTFFDGRGRPLAKYSVGGGSLTSDYEAAFDDRFRKLYRGMLLRPRPESEMLPMMDRLRMIAYLRKSIRNNPMMAALVYRYALLVGAPTVKADGHDIAFNDEKERALERRLRSIMWGTGWSWHRLHKIISIEELIAGEVFAVEVEDKVQLVPAELCGSPAVPPDGELDGIGYDDDGKPVYYRFGVRIPGAVGQRWTRVSFEESDGAQIVDAEFVSHLGQPSRIEEKRYSPKLAPVIGHVQHLDDIIKAKVTTVKNQSALSVFFKKNFDPNLFAEAMSDVVTVNSGVLLAQGTARSNYQTIENGSVIYGEVGEEAELLEPKLNAQDFSQFALMLFDQICAPVGMISEEVVVGYRNSNYSSARADRLRLSDMLKDVRKEREAFCDRVIERQIGISVDSGELSDSQDNIADVTYFWPVIREIDEAKHIEAQAKAIETGQKSLDQVQAESGNYPDKVDAQIMTGATRKAKMLKAYASTPTPTQADIDAQVVTVEEIARFIPLRSVVDAATQPTAQSQPPLQ